MWLVPYQDYKGAQVCSLAALRRTPCKRHQTLFFLFDTMTNFGLSQGLPNWGARWPSGHVASIMGGSASLIVQPRFIAPLYKTTPQLWTPDLQACTAPVCFVRLRERLAYRLRSYSCLKRHGLTTGDALLPCCNDKDGGPFSARHRVADLP